MKMNSKTALAAILMASVSQIAIAQNAPKNDKEIIIVTATRKKTDLLKTPIPVSAFTQTELTRQNITTAVQIADIVPNLEIHVSPVDSGTSFTLRGITSNNNTELGDPSVALHIDGVYSPRPQGALALIYDLERLEVLRGPQGTLYGRNATGGSINVITAKPNFDSISGSIGAELGAYNHKQFRGTFNLPLSDKLAIRINGFIEKRDGWLDQRFDNRDLSGDGIPDVDQRRNVRLSPEDFYYNSDKVALRGSALYNIADNWNLRATYEYFQDNSAGAINFQDCERGADNCKAYGMQRDTVFVNVPGVRELTIKNLRLSSEYKFSDALSVIAAYGRSDQARKQQFDDDGGRRPLPGSMVWTFNIPAFNTITQWEDTMQSHPLAHTLSESFELQFQGKVGKLDYLVGLFSFDEKSDSIFSIETPFCCSAPWLGGTIVLAPDIGSNSKAAFANLTYDFTDKLALNVGIRQTWDKKHIKDVKGYNCYGGFNVDLNTGKACSLGVGALSNNGVDWGAGFGGVNGWPTYNSNTLLTSFQAGLPYIGNYALTSIGNFADKWSHTDYRVGLDYKLGDNGLLYGFVATGYKAGGFSQANNFDGSGVITAGESVYFSYDPETVLNYELGYKARLLDRKLQIAANIFRSDYNDKQETAVRVVGKDKNTGLDITALVTENVADSYLQGLELEADWQLGAGRLKVSASFLDTAIQDNPDFSDYWFCSARASTSAPCDPNLKAKGLELPFAPDYKLSASYSHDFKTANGVIRPWVQINHESSMWLSSTNFNKIEKYSAERPAFTMINATLGYYPNDGKWSVEAYCANCTDEWVRSWAIPAGNGQYAFGGYREPIHYGIRANLKF